MKKTNYSFFRLDGHACSPNVVADIQALYGSCTIASSATLKMCNHEMVFVARNVSKKQTPIVGLLTLSAACDPIGEIAIAHLPLVAENDRSTELLRPLFETAISFARRKRFIQMKTAFPLTALDLPHLRVLKELGFSTNSFQVHQLTL